MTYTRRSINVCTPRFSPTQIGERKRSFSDLVRHRTAADKLAAVCRMWSMQVRLSRIGLQSRYPEAGPDEMRKRLCALLHGREIALQVFGWDPEREGY